MKYEYQIINSKLIFDSYQDKVFSFISLKENNERIEKRLNELGDEGWKLISVNDYGNGTGFYNYTLMREKKN